MNASVSPGPASSRPGLTVELPARTAPSPVPARRLVALLGLTAIGAGAAQITAQILSLPLKVAQIAPDTSTSALSVVLGIGTIMQLVAFPLIGTASDRTLGRAGRRRPWLVAGAALFAAGTLAMLLAPSLPVVIAGWTLNSLGYAAATVPASAVIADQYAPQERGLPSALVGVGPALGTLVGLFLAQLVPGNLAASFLLPAALGIAGPLLLAALLDDQPLDPADRPPLTRRAVVDTFWVSPRAYPDFAFAWASRFMLFLGVASANMYEVFFLIDVLHTPGPQVARAVFISQVVGNGLSFVVAPGVSRLSDRIGRRKPFVIGAALVFAIGLLIISRAHSFGSFLAGFAVFGIGLGIYLAVDLALVTQILPDPASAAKDLGIMNLANSVPGSIVPVIAPVLLAIGIADGASGRNYPALFLFGAAAATAGAALILPIRRVR